MMVNLCVTNAKISFLNNTLKKEIKSNKEIKSIQVAEFQTSDKSTEELKEFCDFIYKNHPDLVSTPSPTTN